MTTKIDYSKMSKEEIINELIKLKENSSSTVKSKIMSLLKNNDFISLDEISKNVNANKNVISSVLTSIRKDGYKIINIKINNVNYIKLLKVDNEVDKEIIKQIENINK